MFCGGQGVYLVNLARALLERGHRVRLMSGPPYPDSVPGVETELVPDENFINKSARALPEAAPVSVFAPLNFMEYALARAGANPEMLAFSMRCFDKIKRLHAADPVDVVHDNQGLGYGLLLIRALGIPVVATIHHPLQVDRAEDILQSDGFIARMRRALYYPIIMQKLTAKKLDRVITVSDFSKNLVLRIYGLEPAATAVVHNGVDASVFRPPNGVEREPGRLLFVGSSEDRKKGVKYLLQALAGLPERFRLKIVDGRRYPGRVYASSLVEKLGISSRVEFRDKITNQELIEEYARAEMMVVSSLFEGFGLPALEAMACGVPLVCTTAGALPEVATPECAALIEPRSAQAIREAVLRLDGDVEGRERMSKAGRRRALERFSWAAAAEKVEEHYKLAISKRKADARGAMPLQGLHPAKLRDLDDR
jgi:glycosyltransferase involved in cell wall biosynthesis